MVRNPQNMKSVIEDHSSCTVVIGGHLADYLRTNYILFI
jgi:hypothetical protein